MMMIIYLVITIYIFKMKETLHAPPPQLLPPIITRDTAVRQKKSLSTDWS